MAHARPHPPPLSRSRRLLARLLRGRPRRNDRDTHPKAIALHTKTEQLRGMDEPNERRNPLVDQLADLEMDFSTEYQRMVEVFKPYLKLGNI